MWLGTGCAPSSSPDAMCVREAKLSCKWLYQCCTTVERVEIGQGSHQTQAECEEDYVDLYCDDFKVAQESVEAGRIEWKNQEAEECVARREQAADRCNTETLVAREEQCALAEFTVAKVGDDSTCYRDFECEGYPNAVCQRSTTGNSDETTVTVAGTCSSIPPKDGGNFCRSDIECASGICDDDYSECGYVLKNNGEACDYDSECVDGICDYDSGQCIAKKDNGESCEYSSECASGSCASDSLECEPLRNDGESCDYSSDCASGNCDADSFECTRPRRDGESCSSDSECASGNCDYDDEYELFCMPPKAEGEWCSSDSQCASGECSYNRNYEDSGVCFNGESEVIVYDLCTGGGASG